MTDLTQRLAKPRIVDDFAPPAVRERQLIELEHAISMNYLATLSHTISRLPYPDMMDIATEIHAIMAEQKTAGADAWEPSPETMAAALFKWSMKRAKREVAPSQPE